MDIKNWLDADRGRYKALAAHIGVSLSRVSQIASDGVPAKYMMVVREFTGGAVTLEEMVMARTPQPAAAIEEQAGPTDTATQPAEQEG